MFQFHFCTGRPSHFISDVLEKQGLTKIYKSYESKRLRGAPPNDPRLLLKIMIYGYSIGTRSSRKLEKTTYENVAFRILSCDQHPDHDTIAAFRRNKGRRGDELQLRLKNFTN